jgi:hypothetical protein
MTRETEIELAAADAELAAYYESRKGDVSTWAKSPRKLRRKRGDGPSTAFAFRLTPDELEELQRAAQQRDVSLSEFIRSSSLQAARATAAPQRA